MKTTARALVTAATALAATVLPAGAALAEQTPVLVSQHGAHQVWYSAGEPYDVPDDMKNAYWGFVPLDGMCGFPSVRLELSDMRETFFIQQKQNGAKAGTATGEAKLLDETFELTQLDADGAAVRTFRGLGDEYATMANSVDGAPTRVDLRVVFRGSSDDGTKLSFSLRLQLRSDARTGELTRMDGEVTSCHVS